MNSKTSLRVTRRGNCYAAAEALFHILGGRRAGYMPMLIRAGLPLGDTHWFLKHIPYRYAPDSVCTIIDPSRKQFTRDQQQWLNHIGYRQAKPCAFLTKRPSKRAKALIQTLTWQFVNVARY